MNRQKIDLRKILIPSDFVAIFVILLGLVIAIFLHELAIRLIGISIAILGAVAFFMLISQRINEYVDIKRTPKVPPQNFKVTKKVESTAVRTVYEDFSSSFGEEIDNKTQIKHKDSNFDDVGFRIVNKSGQKSEIVQQTKTSIESIEPTITEFSDDFSGIKIVGKFKAKESVEPKYASEKHLQNKVDNQQAETIKEFEPQEISKKVDSVEPPKQEQIFGDKKTLSELTIEKDIEEKEKVEIPESIEESPYKEKEFDLQINLLIEEFESLAEEPRKEFDYFLNRVLLIIRSLFNIRTATFILVNNEKKQLILEAFSTDVPNAIIDNRKIALGNDIVSQIFQHQKPEVLTEINPKAELDLIPYYKKSVKTGSFIGVPVFYQGAVIGVLCADTNIIDAYDSLTVTSFGHFTKLLSALVQSYIEKYDLLQESRTLRAINKFSSIITEPEKTLKDIEESLITTVETLIECQAIGLCSYDANYGEWRLKIVKSENPAYRQFLNLRLDLDKTLLGKAIATGESVVTSINNQIHRRFAKNEPLLQTGFFAAIPIPLRSFNGVYGAIFIEGSNISGITSVDIKILETLCEHAGSNIEKLHLIKLIESSPMIDPITGLLNSPALHRRVYEEISRSKKYGTPFVLNLVQIDKYASFDPIKYRNRRERAIMHIIEHIKNNLNSFDIYGKIEDDIIAIGLIGMNLQQAQIWAEQLRKKIASSIIEIDGKGFNVTISQGLADVKNAETVEELINNAKTVLKKSYEKANSVSIYS